MHYKNNKKLQIRSIISRISSSSLQGQIRGHPELDSASRFPVKYGIRQGKIRNDG